MSEQDFDPDAHLVLQTTEGDRIMHRGNSALFTFLGELGMYNHIFVVNEEAEEDNLGMYIFQHNPIFTTLGNYMVKEAFPMHLNMLEVAECDQDAFNRSISKEVEDMGEFPDEWTNEKD